MITEHTTAARAQGADAADPTQARAVGRHRLGADLRQMRQAQALQLADVAAKLEVAPSTLSRIETGQAPVKAGYLNLMLDLYGVHDQAQRDQFTNLARDGMRKSWHHEYRHLLPVGASQYLDLETAATHLRSYSVHAIPDLAQTVGYASAAIRAARPDLSAAQVRSLVAAQRRRQELGRSAGLRLHLVIDESALLRGIGTTAIMAGQLSYLLSLTAMSAVTMQVVELARPLPVLTEPFTILSLRGPAHPEVACHIGVDGQITLAKRHADLSAMDRAFTALANVAASPRDTASIIKKTLAHWEQADLG